MAQSLDKTSPEADGKAVGQPVLAFTTHGPSQRWNQERKAYKQAGAHGECITCRAIMEGGLLKATYFLE